MSPDQERFPTPDIYHYTLSYGGCHPEHSPRVYKDVVTPLVYTTIPLKRALWTENDLGSAVQTVRIGLLSTYKVVVRWNIFRRTIRNHLKPEVEKKVISRKTFLIANLVRRILRYTKRKLQSPNNCSKNIIERRK